MKAKEILFEYFTVQEANLFVFYRIPKEFFTNPKYKKLSADAKILYGLLLDRNGLSLQNRWIDNEGHIYIYFSREEAMEMLGCGHDKIPKLFKELNEAGLIREVRQGLNRPNIIYVGKFIASNADIPTDPRKSEVQNSENRKSGTPKIRSQELRKSESNNTDSNKTYLNESEISQSVSPVLGEDSKTLCQTTDRQTSPPPIQSPEKPKPHLPVCEVTEADIKQQIGYSALATLGDTSLLDEVVLNMLDMYHSCGVKIKDEVKPQAIVHSVLSKVTYWHIVYLLDRFKQVTTPIKNKKSYLQTMIYNSVLEQQAHFTNEVQVDMLDWAKELSHSQEQKQDQAAAKPQRDNFEQREYDDEELERFYANLT